MEQKQNNILDHLKVKRVEVMPEAYFVDLANKSIKKKSKIISLRIVIWSAAAAIALFLVSLPLLNPGQTESKNYSFSEITSSEALAYVDEHINEFEDELIIDFIESELITLPEIVVKIETNKEETFSEAIESLDEIDTESILEYLMYEGIENDEIDEYEL